MHDLAHLISVLIGVEILLIVVRVLLSWFPDIDPYNPLVRLLRAAVDPVLAIFRPILPAFSGIDVSPILAIVVLDQVRNVLDAYAAGVGLTAAYVVVTIVGEVLTDVIVVFVVVLALRVIVSLLGADPFHPLVRLVREVSRPVVQPLTGWLPRTRSVDLPGVIALAALIVVYFLVRNLFDTLRLHTL